MKKNLTQNQLDRMLAKWQAILRVQDWDISVRIVDSEMIPNKLGECKTYCSTREAAIRLIDAQQIDTNHKSFVRSFDQEQILVHELLHVVTWWLVKPENDIELQTFEAAIDNLSWALIELERAKI